MKPDEYEEFVARACQELMPCHGVQVWRQREFVGRRSGRTIKIDVSFEMSVLGTRVLFLGECKCYKNRVSVGEVEEFHSKLDDIGGHKGIMFTTVGYQAGAQRAARGFGIALIDLSPDARRRGMRVVMKAYKRQRRRQKPSLLRGSILAAGRLRAEESAAELGFESGQEMLRVLAYTLFSEVAWQDVFHGAAPATGSPAETLSNRENDEHFD